MNVEQPLVEWAARFGTTVAASSPEHLRQKMEATLLPMIRCALRSGLGQPPLLRWVRGQQALLCADGQADPARQAAPLARRLSQHLVARLAPPAECETVLSV